MYAELEPVSLFILWQIMFVVFVCELKVNTVCYNLQGAAEKSSQLIFVQFANSRSKFRSENLLT